MAASVLAAIVLVAVAVALAPVLRDPEPGFARRHGTLVEVVETAVRRRPNGTFRDLRLTSSSGLRVELTVLEPLGVSGRRPCVILIGGQATGRAAADLIGDSRGVVLAALSYPYEGRRTGGAAMLLDLPDMQRALRDVTPAILLAVDHLVARPEVDADRIELVGVSLGAYVVPPAGALDPRISRVWLVHGGGAPDLVFDRALEDRIGWRPLRRVAAAFLAQAAGSRHLSPERWVGRISPRPVVAVFASGDRSIPRPAVEALRAELREPFEEIWMEGDHVHPERRRIVERIVEIVLKKVARDGGEPS